MARIYQRGKIWYLDLTYKGRRIRKKVGTSKRMAELALKDAEIKIIKDEYGFSKSDISVGGRCPHLPPEKARYRIN